ncbi:hypothetical protein GGE16_004446 [Rhizobium leguminosarum]|uniref:Uncharacterized protein n=1 Tax=Rhizobium leguminosarum TaxID=384 RepID=A0AAE2MN06_RHILE|nr:MULTISPECIES: hypothetical protein [Rhizobium]MBB4292367.1 hypothetical protein [Rhizobium leguminosarum]MBB4298605.1 hypothetical protein [Rhizobium leguminosarum]MBB4310421.1 hypothetical protein [Rhizobium leguminosarum]MBB4434683.1 hypothetical protein [Rhizobium esperanzae]MBB4531579.1 hypothetical protein [Rhizobium leguminosarum]
MTIKTSNSASFYNVVEAISAVQVPHPHKHFSHPEEVLASDGITTAEKGAILASWAPDLHAVESCPELRHPPGAASPIHCQNILSALKALDGTREDFGVTRRERAHKSIRIIIE